MSAMVKAHGMDGSLVDPDWPPLTRDELRRLLAQFPDLGEPAHIVSASPRPFSAAGVVAAQNGRVFIKRHHRAVRDREGLLEEHRFLSHLLAHGASVPRVLASVTGETAIEFGDWTYEVHEIPPGVDLYRDAISWTPFHSVAHAHSAGVALARLHIAAQNFNAPPRQQRPLVASFTIFAAVDPAAADPAAAMERYLTAHPSLSANESVRASAERALEFLAPFHAELAPLLPALAPLWTHNDLHASNFFWSDSGPSADLTARATAIIDFGLADRTNAVHDIAHAIERNIVGWLALVKDPSHPDDVPIHLDHLETLLDGYDSIRQLSSEESSALAPMTALCHAEFALSEADYFLGVLHSEEKAAMAYDGWLVGHARWFHSRAGRKLLDALRRWAGRKDLPRAVRPERKAGEP